MAALPDRYQGFADEFGSAVPSLCGRLGVGREAIRPGYDPGQPFHGFYMDLKALPYFEEEPLFQFDDSFRSPVYLALDLGQAVCGIAFAGHEGLPADEMRGHGVELALRHLQVVADDLVVADSEGLDARVPSLVIEILLEDMGGVLLDRPQAIQFLAIAFPHKVPFGQEHGGFIGDRVSYSLGR